ncbi:MAG: thioredoxin domain-containing protein [Candidatus Omnitrophica bacterium]|nr:thioredoxin domain-containing protein [Candidatus Omnitrophota bacterium]
MKRERKKRRPPVDPAARAWFMIFVLIILISLAIYIDYQRRVQTATPDAPIPGRFWGDPKAELHITQFWDLANPEGVRGERLLEQYLTKYPDEIFFQTRYFPQDDKSLLITLYAECANRQKKFRPFLKLLFVRQFQWGSLASVSPILKTVATDAGLDVNKLSACVASQDAVATVTVDRVYGESLFVHTTPTYFLNGKMAEGVGEFDKALKEWESYFLDDE